MKKIFDNRFYNFIHDPERNILIFEWTEETSSMTDDDFKEALSNYAGFSFELNGPGLLVDVRKFRHQMGEEVMNWRNEVCLPRYMAAGSFKMAYLMPKEALTDRPSGDLPIGKFTDRFWGSMDEAKDWLSS